MFGFGFFDSVFPVLFTVMFVLILGVIIATLVRNVGQWHKNNKSPRLTVQATVVSKRMELSIPDRDYGYLVEGDRGSLTFQGTRFLSFSRD